MKVAFPTDDGKTISPHFGRAPYYLIAVFEEGSEAHFEQREKTHHGADERGGHHEEHNHNRDHSDMFASLSDCQVLIAGGMGQPAHSHALSMGLQVILPAEKDIENALTLFQRGELKSDPRRIHNRGQGIVNLDSGVTS